MNRAEAFLAELAEASWGREVLRAPVDPAIARQTKDRFLIPDNSLLGALAASGGFLIDGGKLRVLGSPADGRSLLSANSDGDFDPLADFLVVADDIYGNFTAINVDPSGPFRPGEMIAFYADGTGWESTADDLADFLSFCFQGDLTDFFGDFATGDPALERAAMADPARVISFYPPLSTREGSPSGSSRRLVSASEALSLRLSFAGHRQS